MFHILQPMQTPDRLLRDTADGLPGRETLLTDKQLARREEILSAALALIARHGRVGLTMGRFATALRIGAATIRRYFVDLDSILAELLARHLVAIMEAFADFPDAAPHLKTALRAAYLQATRGADGGFTDAHTLLLRERHTLPPDLSADIEEARDRIGQILAGQHAATALALLDTPGVAAAQIEAMLAALDPPKPQPRPARVSECRDTPSIPGPIKPSRSDLLATASMPWPHHATRWTGPPRPEPRAASP
jgi:AcrR family transcriptional regulator